MVYQTIPTPDFSSQIASAGNGGWHPAANAAALQSVFQPPAMLGAATAAPTQPADLISQIYASLRAAGAPKQSTGNPLLDKLIQMLMNASLQQQSPQPYGTQ